MFLKTSGLNQSANKVYQSQTTYFLCYSAFIMLLLVGCGRSDIENQLDEYLKNQKATGVLMVKQLAIDMPTENTNYVCYLPPYQSRVGQYYDKKRSVPIFAEKINKSLARVGPISAA